MTRGAGTCQSPRLTCRSLWHTPAAAIATQTSPGPGGSRSTSRTCTGSVGLVNTTARTRAPCSQASMVASMAAGFSVRVDDIRLAYKVIGSADAPPMVLLHALGGQGAGWEPVAGIFAERFPVFAFAMHRPA